MAGAVLQAGRPVAVAHARVRRVRAGQFAHDTQARPAGFLGGDLLVGQRLQRAGQLGDGAEHLVGQPAEAPGLNERRATVLTSGLHHDAQAFGVLVVIEGHAACAAAVRGVADL